jgi:hypothetical protein
MSLGDYVQKLEGDYGIAPAGLDLDAPFNNIRLRSDKDSLDRLKELDRIHDTRLAHYHSVMEDKSEIMVYHMNDFSENPDAATAAFAYKNALISFIDELMADPLLEASSEMMQHDYANILLLYYKSQNKANNAKYPTTFEELGLNLS